MPAGIRQLRGTERSRDLIQQPILRRQHHVWRGVEQLPPGSVRQLVLAQVAHGTTRSGWWDGEGDVLRRGRRLGLPRLPPPA